MTIEEKARAYDEALEVAKRNLEAIEEYGEGSSFAYEGFKNTLIHMFPQLTESEDERIRKAIINILHEIENDEDWCGTNNIKDYIAWLEKQKPADLNNISIIRMVDTYRGTDEYDEDGNLKGKPVNCMIRAYEKGIRDILKIIKQNPVEYNEVDSKLECREWAEKYYPNQTWEIKDMIAHGYLAGRVNAFMDAEQEAKEKYKPVEWSEEDEAMHTRCVGALGKCYMGVLPETVTEELEWLKSISPKSQWKPSKGQLNALKIWLDDNRYNGNVRYVYSIFDQLYEQLKSL